MTTNTLVREIHDGPKPSLATDNKKSVWTWPRPSTTRLLIHHPAFQCNQTTFQASRSHSRGSLHTCIHQPNPRYDYIQQSPLVWQWANWALVTSSASLLTPFSTTEVRPHPSKIFLSSSLPLYPRHPPVSLTILAIPSSTVAIVTLTFTQLRSLQLPQKGSELGKSGAPWWILEIGEQSGKRTEHRIKQLPKQGDVV